jgi:hypothetical protein
VQQQDLDGAEERALRRLVDALDPGESAPCPARHGDCVPLLVAANCGARMRPTTLPSAANRFLSTIASRISRKASARIL